jgi:hypothetical protein
MKLTALIISILLGSVCFGQSTNNIPQQVIHDGAIAICECTGLVQSRLSPQCQEIVTYKLIAESNEEWETAMAIFIYNNPDLASKDLAVIEEMNQEGKPFMQCIHKIEMQFSNSGADTPAAYELIMMELYEIQCEFAAALMQLGSQQSN